MKKKKQKRLLLSGVVLVFAIGYLTFSMFGNSMAYFETPGELIAQGESVYGKAVRVNGDVLPGSMVREPLNLQFTVTAGDGSVPVVYKGIDIPDTLKDGAEVVVEGKLEADGIFLASKILAKCPSKYEAES